MTEKGLFEQELLMNAARLLSAFFSCAVLIAGPGEKIFADDNGMLPLYVPHLSKEPSRILAPLREAETSGIVLDEQGSLDLEAMEAKNRKIRKIQERLKLAQATYDGLQGIQEDSERSRRYWSRRVETLGKKLENLSNNRKLDPGSYNYHVSAWKENASKADAYAESGKLIQMKAENFLRLLKLFLMPDIRSSQEFITGADRQDLPRAMDTAEELSENAYEQIVQILKQAYGLKDDLNYLAFIERRDRELNHENNSTSASPH
ncbi:MAG: hypothetical protein HY547_08005 [Elusimicrobia bacterium]|nr:hypothetical protein [Elusimicrobiota bacterium]